MNLFVKTVVVVSLSFIVLTPATLAQNGNVKAAKYHKMLQKRPSAGYLYERFYNSWLENDTSESLEIFLEDIVTKTPTANNKLLFAFFYTIQGKDINALALLTEAAKVWQQLIDRDKSDLTIYEDLIEFQVSEGLFDQAIKRVDQLLALTKDPYQSVIYQLRKGDIHQYNGKTDASLSTYRNTLDHVAHDGWLEKQILSQIDEVYRREENITGLKKCLEDLIKTHPKRMNLKLRLAKILTQTEDIEGASKLYQTILKLTPGDRGNQEAYIAMLTQVGKLDDAISLLNALITQYPDDIELRIQIASLYHKAKKEDLAEKALMAYLSISEETEYNYLRVARLFERFKQIDNAEKTYKKLITIFGNSDPDKETYAMFLYRNDHEQKALDIYKPLSKRCDIQMLLRINAALKSKKQRPLLCHDAS